MEKIPHRTRTIGASARLVWLCQSLVLAGTACGPSARITVERQSSLAYRDYIENSQQMILDGSGKDEVLDTLLCFWKNSDIPWDMRFGALHAYAHIAANDTTIRQTFLELVVERDREHGECSDALCRYLMYFATDEVRRHLLDLVKKQTRCGEAYNTLRELGDPDLLRLVEERIAVLAPNDPNLPIYREQAAYIRAMQSLGGLLEFVASERTRVSSYELERSLVRLGCTRDRLRKCYLEEIAEYDGSERDVRAYRSYVSSLFRRGILTEADIATLPVELQRIRPIVEGDMEPARRWPEWATYLDEKKGAFWNPPENVNNANKGRD